MNLKSASLLTEEPQAASATVSFDKMLLHSTSAAGGESCFFARSGIPGEEVFKVCPSLLHLQQWAAV